MADATQAPAGSGAPAGASGAGRQAARVPPAPASNPPPVDPNDPRVRAIVTAQLESRAIQQAADREVARVLREQSQVGGQTQVVTVTGAGPTLPMHAFPRSSTARIPATPASAASPSASSGLQRNGGNSGDRHQPGGGDGDDDDDDPNRGGGGPPGGGPPGGGGGPPGGGAPGGGGGAPAPAYAPPMRAPHLPSPDKWSGNPDKGKQMRGKVWIALFLSYCMHYSFDPVFTLAAFLTGPALDWWYSLTEHYARLSAVITWHMVQQEFLSYFDPQRRTEPVEARAQLMSHKRTMTHYPTVKQYEQEFKRLVRACADLSLTDQLCWFISGLTPALKLAAATQPDGTEWNNLDALITFALGVETRIDIANASTVHTTKKPRLSAATAVPQARKANPSGSSRAKALKGGVAKHSQVPSEIKGGLRGLWLATQAQHWTDPDGKPYTVASWLKHVTKDRKCLVCHKPLGTDPGQCPVGSHKPVGGGGGRVA